MENWVERRALRAKNLAAADGVWESARAAIHDCCNSYEKHFADIAEVTNQPDNGHRIRVGIHFPQVKLGHSVSIEYGKDARKQPQIAVTVDDKPAMKFPITADEDHAFISWQNKEISADEFSRLALEEALFKVPEPKKWVPQGGSGQWS